MEGIITAVLTSLIISAFVALFQKSKTKIHAQIKFGVMLILEIILVPMIFGVAAIDPAFITLGFLILLPLCCFIGYKMYKIYLQIRNNDYYIPENDKEDKSMSNVGDKLKK